MGKHYYHFILFILIALILGSCSSNKFAASFGKRRYTRGYYADVSSRKPAIPESEPVKALVKTVPVIKTVTPVYSISIARVNSKETRPYLPKPATRVYVKSRVAQAQTVHKNNFIATSEPVSNEQPETNGESDTKEHDYGWLYFAIIMAILIAISFAVSQTAPLATATLVIVNGIIAFLVATLVTVLLIRLIYGNNSSGVSGRIAVDLFRLIFEITFGLLQAMHK